MWRFLILVSIIAIVIAELARWLLGLRVLRSEGQRLCHCDLGKWLPAPGDQAVVQRSEGTASEFARQLRLKALADWREQDRKGALARENSRRFGMAVPPLSGLVAVFAVIVAKVPIVGAVAILLGATALAATFGLLSIGAELRAVGRAVRRARETKMFPARDDEDAVARCAAAHVWNENLLPILKPFLPN